MSTTANHKYIENLVNFDSSGLDDTQIEMVLSKLNNLITVVGRLYEKINIAGDGLINEQEIYYIIDEMCINYMRNRIGQGNFKRIQDFDDLHMRVMRLGLSGSMDNREIEYMVNSILLNHEIGVKVFNKENRGITDDIYSRTFINYLLNYRVYYIDNILLDREQYKEKLVSLHRALAKVFARDYAGDEKMFYADVSLWAYVIPLLDDGVYYMNEPNSKSNNMNTLIRTFGRSLFNDILFGDLVMSIVSIGNKFDYSGISSKSNNNKIIAFLIGAIILITIITLIAVYAPKDNFTPFRNPKLMPNYVKSIMPYKHY